MLTRLLFRFCLSCVAVFILTACSKADCDKNTPVQFQFNLHKIDTLKHLRGVDFVNENLGILVGDQGLILRTTDGGKTFTEIESGTDNNLYRVTFTSHSIAYIIGNNQSVLKSEDGGLNWKKLLPENPGRHFRSMQFFNDSVGIISGHYGKLYKTQNGGKSWEIKNIKGNTPQDNLTAYSMYWKNYDEGYIGCNFGSFYKVNHDQTEIILENYYGPTCAYFDIEPISDNTLITAYSNHPNFGRIQQFEFSPNYSSKTIYQYPEPDFLIWSIRKYTPFIFIAVGGEIHESTGSILISQDKGVNWKEYPTQFQTLADIDVEKEYIFVVGNNGTFISNRF